MYEYTNHIVTGEPSPAQVAAELFNAWNAHDVERVMALYAPDYEGVDVGQATPEHGPDGKRDAVQVYLRAFPDLYFHTEDTIVEQGRAVVSWIARGTHHGSLMHIPPTGRTVHVRGVTILSIADGKILSGVYIWDVAGMLREIGLLPEL